MPTIKPPVLAQIAMCSPQLPRSMEFFTTVFGFGDAGAEVAWGDFLAQLQGLGDKASCILWWLVGKQDFLQLEIFQHSIPTPRLLPEDWSPKSVGWVRWGAAVPDFDQFMARLKAFGVEPIAPLKAYSDGVRRVSVRDPFVGTIIEVLEDGPSIPGGLRASVRPLGPSIIYATVSTSSLALAREFWVGVLELEEVPPHTLHTNDMEELWGLAGEEPSRLVVKAGDCFVEIVEYPAASAERSASRPLSDQGIMNVAIGFRDRPSLDDLVARLRGTGINLNTPLPGHGLPAGSYIRAPDGTSVEILAIGREHEEVFGFQPRKITALQVVTKDAD